jgi:DNA modification methylase
MTREKLGRHTLAHGDCLEVLRTLEDNTVDAVITDPPYGLGFMGKAWDALPPGDEWAREVFRVCKPGAHLVAFGGTRTIHRLTTALENAQWTIRDMWCWTYASGFPKSLAVDQAIERRRHDGDQVRQVTRWIREMRDRAGISNEEIDRAFGFHGMAGHWSSQASQPAIPTLDQVPTLLAVLKVDTVPDEIGRLLVELNGNKGEPGHAWHDRQVVARGVSSLGGTVAAGERDLAFQERHKGMVYDITAPATEEGRRWQGYGTALKPAYEPAVLARKPLDGTVAYNALLWGTGAINIDGARVEGGRWPANTYHASKPSTAEREAGCTHLAQHAGGELTGRKEGSAGLSSPRAGAGRLSSGRGNVHPTVKPLAVMRQLVRLLAPQQDALVLDTFLGSGTTLLACELEGHRCLGIEREAEYLTIIRARFGGLPVLRRLQSGDSVSDEEAAALMAQGELFDTGRGR